MNWWTRLHPSIKILLALCLVFGLVKGALEVFLPYHDDAETVRHAAKKAGLIGCETQQARAGHTGDELLSVCTCAGEHFAASLTDAQIKPLQSHREQIGPRFTVTPAMQPQLDSAIGSCISTR